MNSASEAMFFFTFLLLGLISDWIHTPGNTAAAVLLSVRQEPEVMEVAPGSNVTMKCHYQDSAAVSDTRKHIFFIALWTALSMAALTVVTGFLICCKYKRTKLASSTGENDCQVSDALESEVQYATLNVRLKSPRPDSRGGQGQISNVNTSAEPTSVVYSTIR
nr:uncharacterized protein LOC111839302 isoform X3 [Paramormyrops kingsleyae]